MEKPRNSWMEGANWIVCATTVPFGVGNTAPAHEINSIGAHSANSWTCCGSDFLKYTGITIHLKTTCVAHSSAGQHCWDLCNCLYMCFRHHLHVGRNTYKVSHPVPNGLPDVQKSLTIVQNLQTPPRQNCQVEKAEVSKKIQIIA